MMRGTLKKQPADRMVFELPFADLLASGDSISAVDSVTSAAQGWITGAAALTINSNAISGTNVDIDIEGGTDGELYIVTGVVSTTNGETIEHEGRLYVVDLDLWNRLVNFSDLKEVLNLKLAGGLDSYPLVEMLIWSTRAAFENFTQREFQYRTRTESFNVGLRDKSDFYVKNVPLKTLTSVTITDREGASEVIDNDIIIRDDYGVILPRTVRNSDVDIVYTGGLQSFPDDMARAAVLQIQNEFRILNNQDSFVTEDGNVVQPVVGLTNEVKRILAPYVHPGLGFI